MMWRKGFPAGGGEAFLYFGRSFRARKSFCLAGWLQNGYNMLITNPKE